MINLIPESSSALPEARQRYNTRAMVCVVVLVMAILGLSWIDEAAPKLIAVAVSFLALFGLVFEFVRLMRSLDELQQRIHLSALSIGLGCITLLSVCGGVVTLAFGLDLPAGTISRMMIFALPLAVLAYYAALYFVIRWFR